MARYRQGWSRGWKKSLRGNNGEWFDSSWELQYMDELERDPLVVQWTRHHGLRIPYRKWWGGLGHYEPDFLVKLVGGGKEIREVKGEHLFRDKNTAKKLQVGERYCRKHGMIFRVVTKSEVNPDISSLENRVVIENAPQSERPVSEVGPLQSKKVGCFNMIVMGATLLGLILWIIRWL